jgi:hypothetical protein
MPYIVNPSYRRKQDVFGLDIPMRDVMLMQELNGEDDLSDDRGRLSFGELGGVLVEVVE